MSTCLMKLPDTVLPDLHDPGGLHVQETRDGVGRRYDCGDHSVPMAVCGVWLAEQPATAEQQRHGQPCALCLRQLGLRQLPGRSS